MVRDIRISSGWGFANSFTIDEFQQLADLSDGLELFITSEDRFTFMKEADLTMETASLHLQTPPNTVVERFHKLKKHYPIEVVVIHLTNQIELLQKIQEEIETPPLTFENQDRSVENGDELIQEAKKSGAEFTIDIQNLAETRTNAESQALIDDLGPHIKQFHIAGFDEETTANHELVVNSNKRGSIVPLLEYISTHHDVENVPWVIEGKYTTVDEVEDEIDFLSDF